jgi:hypothetical protein
VRNFKPQQPADVPGRNQRAPISKQKNISSLRNNTIMPCLLTRISNFMGYLLAICWGVKKTMVACIVPQNQATPHQHLSVSH